MLRIQSEIAMCPGAISGIDVIGFIPRLRFSSYRKEQLDANENQQETERSDFIDLEAFVGTQIHGTSEFERNESSIVRVGVVWVEQVIVASL